MNYRNFLKRWRHRQPLGIRGTHGLQGDVTGLPTRVVAEAPGPGAAGAKRTSGSSRDRGRAYFKCGRPEACLVIPR